jgi:hypothetical protein
MRAVRRASRAKFSHLEMKKTKLGHPEFPASVAVIQAPMIEEKKMVETVARWGNNALMVSLGLLTLAVLIVAR